MRIRQVHIDHYAGWEATTLDLPDEEMHVLYGPNETGKSTLLRFLRGVLYGFEERDCWAGTGERRSLCSGRLRVSFRGNDCFIHRESTSFGADRIWLTDVSGQIVPNSELDELLGGVDSRTFRNVFAIGLSELQEIATLHADKVADHIYHVSLGPAGRQIVDAHSAIRCRAKQLLDEESSEGSIVTLAKQISDIDEQIADCEQQAQRHSAIGEELRRIESELQDQRVRQRGLQGQLRGHEFMERIAGPWQRKQEIETELAELPCIAGVPDRGIDQFDELELEIEEVSDRRKAHVREARRLAKAAAAVDVDSRLAGHAVAILSLLSRRDEFGETQARVSDLQCDGEQARRQLEAAVSALGETWNETRLEAFDDSPAAMIKLVRCARRYRDGLKRRTRDVRRYQRIASRLQQQQFDLGQQLRSFQAADAAEASESCRRNLARLEELSSNDARMRTLERNREDLAAELSARGTARGLPPYFFSVLIAFGIVGVVLLITGVISLVQGVTGHTPWIAGLIFALMGIACSGVTWTIKRHFDPDAEFEESLKERLRHVTHELTRLRNEGARVRDELSLPLAMSESDASAGFDIAEALDAVKHQMADLSQLARDEQTIKARRLSLSRFREHIRTVQRNVGVTRREWCQLLKEIGLDESVQIDVPLDQWRQSAEAKLQLGRIRSLAGELERAERFTDRFRADVVQLAGQIDEPDIGDGGTIDRLVDWEQRLAARDVSIRERAELRRDSRRQRRAADAASRKLVDLKRRRMELLASVGASNRDDFLHRLESHSRRLELEEELEVTNSELSQAAQSQPDLAVVEEDLRAFDPESNRAAIEAIRRELTDLSGDLESSGERVGRLRQEMAQLETDRRLTGLRFDRAQLRSQLVDELQALCAVKVVSSALDEVRTRLERMHQPQTLSCAGSFLSRLTGGAYRRVWTRCGERRLLVDEAAGGSLSVEQLSAGTREQLFLAIRLALVEQLREQGVHLPVVLDDVLVNFDEERTEAAISTLRDFATADQQVLVFTCHQHLAERFRNAGVSTVNLPSRSEPAHRRVG